MATERDPALVLIVEDDEEIREWIAERLRMERYRVCGAAGGTEALAALADERPDVMLLDAGLPDCDGFELLTRLRGEHAPSLLPIIMLTGLSGREDVVKGLRLGANDYIPKPFDIPVVLARIATQVSIKRTADERRALEADLTRRAEALEKANAALAAANAEMRSDLLWAGRLQRSMLPACTPAVPGVEFAFEYRSCDELGGDLLDIFAIDEDHVGFYLLDVSGHGMKAALLSVQISRLLMPVPDQPCLVRRRHLGLGEFEPTPPVAVAEELNRRFQLQDEFEQYLTLFYAVLDTRTLELRWVAAGHPGPLVISAEQRVQPPGFGQIAIGVLPTPGYQERSLRLQPGDRMYAVSDGIVDTRNGNGEVFGAERLAAAAGCAGGMIDEALRSVIAVARRWSALRFDDDISAIAIDVRSNAAR